MAVRAINQKKKPISKHKNRREELLNAARESFFEHGYRGTTMESIARQAGYSKRTVYLDYLNKDELFISVCALGGEQLFKKLQTLPLKELTISAAIERTVDEFIHFSREHKEYFRMIFSEATPEIIANCSTVLRERVAAIERNCLNVLAQLTERAVNEGIIAEVDPWEAAGIFVGSATGIILLSMGGSQTVFSQEALESLVKKAIWTLWQGLRASGPQFEER